MTVRGRMVCLGAGLGIALLVGCGGEPPPPTETIRSVRTTTVTEPASGRLRRFSGVVEAADSSSISFEVTGIVEEVKVDVGDRIEQGQVLAIMDTSAYQLNVEAAEAAVRQAEVEYQDASNEYARFEEAHRINAQVISERVLERSLASRDAARQAFSYAEARLELARRDLDRTTLRSPFTGVIARRHVDAFQQVQRGQPVYDLFIEGAMEAAISLPESEIGFVHLGLPASVRFPGLGTHVHDGLVTEISEVAGTANAFPVQVTIDAPGPNIRPGVTAEVSLLLGDSGTETRAYLVPITALGIGETQQDSFVFVYEQDTSTVRRTPVATSSVRDDGVVVEEGLSAGDIIVTAGVSFLRDGQQVALMQR